MGRIQGKVSDDQLKALLEQASEIDGSQGVTVTVQRRAFDDDDLDLDNLDL